MTVREIKLFNDVILFEMQRNKLTMLTFSQAWNICWRAMPNLPAYTGLKTTKRQFASELLGYIEDLESNCYISVVRRGIGRFQKILEFELKTIGQEKLSKIIFTKQERMGI
jgi:hypothetical protein